MQNGKLAGACRLTTTVLQWLWKVIHFMCSPASLWFSLISSAVRQRECLFDMLKIQTESVQIMRYRIGYTHKQGFLRLQVPHVANTCTSNWLCPFDAYYDFKQSHSPHAQDRHSGAAVSRTAVCLVVCCQTAWSQGTSETHLCRHYRRC